VDPRVTGTDEETAMGFLDKAKAAARVAVDKGGDKVGDAVDKGMNEANKRTGGKFSDKIDTAADKTKDYLDDLDGKDDDIRNT
jgi:hypothetical protein